MKNICVSLSLMGVLQVILVGADTYPAEVGGGTDGSNDNAFVNGAPDTPKLTARIHCTRSTSTSTSVALTLAVYQSDIDFKYSNIGPYSGNYVEYDTCFLIQAEEYVVTSTVLKPDAGTMAGCGDTSALSLVDDTNSMDDNYPTRTFTTDINFTPTDATYDCGGYQNSDSQAVFGLACKRNEDYDKAFDSIFLVHYNADSSECVALQMDQSFDVEDSSAVIVTRDLEVTFKAFINSDIENSAWPDGPESLDGVNTVTEISWNPVDLGTSIYLECCMKIPAVPKNSPSYRQFFTEGTPMGIYVKTCTATNDATAGTEGINADAPTTIVDNGCGMGANPVIFFKTADNAFKYVKDSEEPTNDWLTTPNCFRSNPFPAVTFARKLANEDAVIVYKCDIEICTSSNDTRCFGDKEATDLSGYPACARRKRETNQQMPDVPRKVSVAVRVNIPESNRTTAAVEACPETNSLVSITTVLSLVLLLSVVISGLMTYNIQSLVHDADDTSSSMIGIANMAIN